MNVLLSIKPYYSNAILSGTKKVEFRKRRLPFETEKVLLYSTLPVGKIEGYFVFHSQHVGNIHEIWSKYEAFGGIEEHQFFKYYNNCVNAYAIIIKDYVRFDKPVSLYEIDEKLVAPQSFRYLTDEQVNKIMERQK